MSIEHFGASADAATLCTQFGITADAVVTAAHATLNDSVHGATPGGHPNGFAPTACGTGDRP